MRVGFSIVAGAFASVLMCFGFVVAHMERVTYETSAWALADTDHKAMVAIGNHSPDQGTACNRLPDVVCADASDLSTIIAALESSHRDWMFEGVVLRKEISAPTAERPPSVAQIRNGAGHGLVEVYAHSGEGGPVVAGRAPRAANEIALHVDLARQLGVSVGDQVLLEDRDHAGTLAPLQFTVTGLTAIAATFIPFSTLEAGYPGLYLGSPYAFVSPAALPAIMGEHDVAALGFIHWNGAPELVTSVLPGATVKDGDALPRGPWYHGNWWMALAVLLAAASVAWWALLARRRWRTAWRNGALLIPIPAATGIVAVTIAALAHAAWVRQIAPYSFLPKPLPLPVPWTITALAAGLAVAAAGAAWNEMRHSRPIDAQNRYRLSHLR